MKKLIFTLLFLMAAGMPFSQTIVTYCPGPGSNDGTDEGGINGGKDTFVYDEQSWVNYGNSTTAVTSPLSTCNYTNLKAYLKFDVSSLPQEVDSVFLCFTMFPYNNYCYSNCDNTFDLRYITDAWDEMQLNWDTKPTAGAPFSDTVRITFPYSGGLLRLNITDAYKAWREGTVVNEGFTIYPLDGWCNNACVGFTFYSSDYLDDISYRPYLEIYTDQPWGVPAASGILSGISSFPNPASDNLMIRFIASKPAGYTLRIFDFSGKLIENKNIEGSSGSQQITLPVSHYRSGPYFYHLSCQEGTASGRFIVSKP